MNSIAWLLLIIKYNFTIEMEKIVLTYMLLQTVILGCTKCWDRLELMAGDYRNNLIFCLANTSDLYLGNMSCGSLWVTCPVVWRAMNLHQHFSSSELIRNMGF